MLDFRESGKPVWPPIWSTAAGSSTTWPPRADEIFLTPTSPLDLVGVATYELFPPRDALDRFGVHPDMLHAGEFKTASNLYTETTFTPEHREMTESLNRDLYEQLVEGIADGSRARGRPRCGPPSTRGRSLPSAAVERGLVDDLLYEDELLERLAPEDPQSRRLRYADYRRSGVVAGLGLGRGPKIAVVYGVGCHQLRGEWLRRHRVVA